MLRKLLFSFSCLIIILAGIYMGFSEKENPQVLGSTDTYAYWFLLHRQSGKEELFKGVPGDRGKSSLYSIFQVKPGMPGERPTPLPQLLGRDYWVITTKAESKDNPETAPYFLTLDIPTSEELPFGPKPYTECKGSAMAGPDGQCNWQIPGSFGLHGVAGNPEKLDSSDPGSSGCIRHSDIDITYLYNLLDPQKEQIRYYINDD